MEYWPEATYRKDGAVEVLSTYDSLPSKEKALDTIRDWADHYNYHLLSARIKVNPIGASDSFEWVRVF